MAMPDFYDEIKFLNSDWGLPTVIKAFPKWDSVTTTILENSPTAYRKKVVAQIRRESLKGNFQVIARTETRTGTITAGGVPCSGQITDYTESFSFVRDAAEE